MVPPQRSCLLSNAVEEPGRDFLAVTRQFLAFNGNCVPLEDRDPAVNAQHQPGPTLAHNPALAVETLSTESFDFATGGAGIARTVRTQHTVRARLSAQRTPTDPLASRAVLKRRDSAIKHTPIPFPVVLCQNAASLRGNTRPTRISASTQDELLPAAAASCWGHVGTLHGRFASVAAHPWQAWPLSAWTLSAYGRAEEGRRSCARAAPTMWSSMLPCRKP